MEGIRSAANRQDEILALTAARRCGSGSRAQDFHRALKQRFEFAPLDKHSTRLLPLWLVRTNYAENLGVHCIFIDIHGDHTLRYFTSMENGVRRY